MILDEKISQFLKASLASLNSTINFPICLIKFNKFRTNTRNRGSSHYASGGYNDDRTAPGPTANRGTHPP